MSSVAEAVASGVLPGRVWFYSNYHCNLACAYCLTESSPDSDKRALSADQMVGIAQQAADLGFTDIGVTGGEPFLAADMPYTLARLTDILPTVVLTNGMLLSDARLERMRPLADRNLKIQISLDADAAETNDSKRGDDNFRKVIANIPRLVDAGLTVRIATTIDGEPDPESMERLCALHRSLGVSDDEHIVRPIVHRGRAVEYGWGVEASTGNLPAELTVMAEGTFWSPFGPTVSNGELDTDLLITRTIDPLRVGAQALLGLVERRPPGEDTTLNIR